MVDVWMFREQPDVIRKSQERRFAPVELVDEILKDYNEWNACRQHCEEQKKRLNELSKECGALMKKGDEESKKKAGELRAESLVLKASIAEDEKRREQLDKQYKDKIPLVGNIVHDSVPISKDEKDNEVVRTWGDDRKPTFDFPMLHHHQLLYRIGGYDPERGVKVSGHRGYFLTNVGVLLNLALISYATAFLNAKNYELLQVPLMVKKTIISETCQLSDFDEQLYKVGESKPLDAEAEKEKGKTDKQIEKEEEDKDKYLIATSEQPISAFHRGEIIEPKSLPLRYAGISTCFRKEAGKSGHDAWGIYRVHQFDKVEQFCITSPEDSWPMHEEMLKTSEEFYQSLGLPYRVVNIVSKELNNAAAKKYDLEGWFPAYTPTADYRELVSCSNCTDYQSRRLNIKWGANTADHWSKRYVHMLNSTLCATTRTICCILENYQTADGVRVPEVLQPYMLGKTFLPFVREMPVVAEKGKKKQHK